MPIFKDFRGWGQSLLKFSGIKFQFHCKSILLEDNYKPRCPLLTVRYWVEIDKSKTIDIFIHHLWSQDIDILLYDIPSLNPLHQVWKIFFSFWDHNQKLKNFLQPYKK